VRQRDGLVRAGVVYEHYFIDDVAIELGDRPGQGGLRVVSGQDHGDSAIIKHSGTIVPRSIA
jgi:hypothetical protein